MKKRSPLPALIGSAMTVAAMCTVLIDTGWLIPVLAACFVVARLSSASSW